MNTHASPSIGAIKNKAIAVRESIVCTPASIQIADPRTKPLLTRKELAGILRIGVSTLSERYNQHSKRYDPTFPRPILLGGGRKVVFSTAEINDWCQRSATRTGQRTH